MATKHAVLIGINRYVNIGPEYQLKGCVNDAKLYHRVLTDRFGFAPENIVELHDEQATREAILAAMQGLVDKIADNDIVVFHFSGHGRQRTARPTTDETEGSGFDNTIMPHDSPSPEGRNLDIQDGEIEAWLAKLTQRTPYVTLIFDCCHSGTMTRDVFAGAVRGVPADTRPVEEMGLPAAPQSVREHRRGGSGWLALSDKYVVIAGCRDNEKSVEFDIDTDHPFNRNGALTYNLCNALMKAKPGTTYRDVFDEARVKVTARFVNQHPQIEGRQNRAVFGVEDIEPLRFITLGTVDGERVTLEGGAAHGLSAGSQWTVYPIGTRQVEGATALGVVEIVSVGPVMSQGKVVSDTGDMSPGARCVETRPSRAVKPFVVDMSALDEQSGTPLRERIEASPLLSAEPAGQGADVRVQVIGPRSSVTADDPFPELGALEDACWALSDRSGQLLAPLRPVAQDGALDTVMHNLDTAARYRNALALDNPHADLDVTFSVFRQLPSAEREPIEAADGGEFTFHHSDKFGFSVQNNTDHNLFFSILDFLPNKQITKFYPADRNCEMIAPGRTVTKKGTMELSDEFSEEGFEVLKLFVSTVETDFSWLSQEGTRSVPDAPSRLTRQLNEAVGVATRASLDDDEETSGVAEAWDAQSVAFTIRRRSD